MFDKVVDMVEAREDAFFIGDVVGGGLILSTSQVTSDTILKVKAVDSNYVGTYYPWVKTIDSRTNKLTSVPPSVLIWSIYIKRFQLFSNGFAPARFKQRWYHWSSYLY